MWVWLENNWNFWVPILVSVCGALWTAGVAKRQKRLDDGLARSKAAYDIILKKEFICYEKLNEIYALLIPCIHDIIDSVTGDNNMSELSLVKRRKCIHEKYSTFIKYIPELKYVLISYEIYLPDKVQNASDESLLFLQQAVPILDSELNKFCKNKIKTIDVNELRKLKDSLLLSCAIARGTIVDHLRDIAKNK